MNRQNRRLKTAKINSYRLALHDFMNREVFKVIKRGSSLGLLQARKTGSPAEHLILTS